MKLDVVRIGLAAVAAVTVACSQVPPEDRPPDTQGFTSAGGLEEPTYLVLSQEYNSDPEIGRWLRTKDFRVALSLAIDRDAINEVVYLGKGTPGNWLTDRDSQYHPGPEWATLDAVRDLDRAGKLLEELGLIDADGDGIRDRLDGRGPLTLRWEVGGGFGVANLRFDVAGRSYNNIAAIIQKSWREIGINLVWTEGQNSLVRMQENKQYMAIHSAPYEAEPWSNAWWRIVPMAAATLIAPEMGRFYESGGLEGMAPTGPDPAYLPLAPQDTFAADSTGMLKKMLELWEQGLEYDEGDPKRVELARELFRIASEEKYTFGLVTIGP